LKVILSNNKIKKNFAFALAVQPSALKQEIKNIVIPEVPTVEDVINQ
jgi:hypothetical protein